MKKNLHLRTKKFTLAASFLVISAMVGSNTSAQTFCDNEVVYFTENFGTGTTAVSNPNILPNTLEYMANGIMEPDGTYRVINNTQQKPEWHASEDHTPGDVNGRMLVINGIGGDFYQNTITRPTGFAAGAYSLSAVVMNVNTPGTCSPTVALLPSLSVTAEYMDAGGNWVPFMNSPFVTGTVPQSDNPTWVRLGGILTLPATGAFVPQNIRLTVGSGTEGGCGNDYALDDISFATCPTGGPLPVSFLGVNAKQKGTGVNIEWATSFESNNKYFEVERSGDGGYTWSAAARVNSQGNSTTKRDYTAFDAKPQLGVNYYRIRQVDFDGTSKFSNTVAVKVSIDKTSGTVLANPFTNNITVDFLSNHNQVLQATLFDNSGRKVVKQQITLNGGASRQNINASQLQKGVYILQVVDENGNIIISNKLIKL